MVLVKRKKPLGKVKYDWAETQDFMFDDLKDYSLELNNLNIELEWLEDEYPEIAALDISDVHTSDILAWYILARKGGVVSDTDIIYTSSFDYERFKNTEFGIVCFKGWPKPDYMPVSFMISQPNPIHEKIYQASLKNVDKNVYESAGTICIEKSVGSFRNIEKQYPEIDVDRLPSQIVFPFSEARPWSEYSKLAFSYNAYPHLHKDAIGIHWYAGAPGHQEINVAYADGDYRKFNNTVTSAIVAAVEKVENNG
jgi:hypothetical protein